MNIAVWVFGSGVATFLTGLFLMFRFAWVEPSHDREAPMVHKRLFGTAFGSLAIGGWITLWSYPFLR